MKLCLRPALCAIAILLLAACDRMPGASSSELFPGEPHVNALSQDFELEAIVGPAPTPGFKTLVYSQTIETASQRVPRDQFVQTVEVRNTRGAMMATKSVYEFENSDVVATEFELQALGMLQLMSLGISPNDGDGTDETRSYVTLIENALGALFPLDAGNRLDYTLKREMAFTPARGRKERREAEYVYEFGVSRTIDSGIYPDLDLREPVWVILERETDPDGGEARRVIHFSSEVGMPVYVETRRGSTVTRKTLREWTPTIERRPG